MAHVHLDMTNEAEREFEYMCGWRCAPRTTPPAAMEQEGCFLLSPGKRNAKIAGIADSHDPRSGKAGGDRPFNTGVRQRFGFDAIESCRLLVLGQQLHGADAVAADRGQKVERLRGGRAEFFAETGTDGVTVREEVVE